MTHPLLRRAGRYMDAMTIICFAINIFGFLLTFAGISHKMVTKDDLKPIEDTINDIKSTIDEITDRVIELEKKSTLLEYRVNKIEKGDDK